MPERIQLRRTKGWRLPTGAIVASRPSKYGNPFHVGDIIGIPIDGGQDWLNATITPEVAKALFRSWVTDPERRDFLDQAIEELRGHNLGCWCGLSDPCHVDVWLDLANRPSRPVGGDAA